jgi:hypothetical protein
VRSDFHAPYSNVAERTAICYRERFRCFLVSLSRSLSFSLSPVNFSGRFLANFLRFLHQSFYLSTLCSSSYKATSYKINNNKKTRGLIFFRVLFHKMSTFLIQAYTRSRYHYYCLRYGLWRTDGWTTINYEIMWKVVWKMSDRYAKPLLVPWDSIMRKIYCATCSLKVSAIMTCVVKYPTEPLTSACRANEISETRSGSQYRVYIKIRGTWNYRWTCQCDVLKIPATCHTTGRF